MPTHLVGSRPAGTRQRPWLGAWALIVLFLHTACVTGLPRATPHLHAARSSAAVANTEQPEGTVADERVRLSLPTRFGAVQVSDFELNEALTTLVLNMPLRVAGSSFPLYLHRKLALASVPLTGEEWRTPLAQSYGRFCERQGTPGDCLELFKDGLGLDGEDKRDLALALSVNAALEARDAELRSMLSTTQVWMTLSLTIIGYLALVAAPEPVSKGVAAALALLMWGYLGWEFFDLVRAWFKLWEEAAEASTFAELREAGDRFGKVIGPNSVRILLLLGTAAVGETAALVSKAPNLPGSVIGMRIDPSKVGNARVFRAWGWELAIVVSEAIKDALERMGATGTKFQEVTGQSTLSAEERARDRKSRELLETADTARETAWRTLGSLDKEVFMPIAMSGSWPGHRQLWRVIRREAGRTLLVTHGLSAPFIERLEPSVGFGLELALEVDAAVKDISKGWPLMLLDRVAEEVAEHEQVRESVKAGLFSMEVSGKGMPKSLVTEEGRVAVLLGVESRTLPRHFSTPYGEVKLVTVKALLPSELAYLLEHGAEGQAELARRFAESGEEHLSRLRRKPVA